MRWENAAREETSMSDRDPGPSPDAPDSSGPSRLDSYGRIARHQTERGDVGGVPTWPITTPDPTAGNVPPPVGLNWGTVADRLGVDRRILQHEGCIVLAGEYFTEAGNFLEPASLEAHQVDVGDIALRHGYFLGALTLGDFHIWLRPGDSPSVRHPVIPSPPKGPMIGLFADTRDAARAKRKIVQGALGSGVSLQDGPLGVELRVERAEVGGRIATVICGHAGAVIAIDGSPIVAADDARAAPATGPSHRDLSRDAPRAGTGVTGETEGEPAGG